MDESVRQARIETKLDHLLDLMERQERAQAKHNDLFYLVRDKVNDMDSKNKGAWFVVGVFSAVVSFLVSFLSRGHS
jgi:hypothetical protein